MIESRNPDGNSLADLAAALRHAGAMIDKIDEERNVIYALVSANDLETIRMMEGVAYVRVVCHYHADRAPILNDAKTLAAAG